MKLNNFKKKYNFLIYIIFIIILFFCIYNYLNIIEPYRKSRSKSRSKSSSSSRKCINKNSCNENETILYKCLNKTDIEDSNEFHTYKRCEDRNKKNSKKPVKCKINDKCDDNYRISYTCIDEDDDDKIETSETNGWSKNKNLDKSCNNNCILL
tara:strand:+ start:50 stop:508 length:459 start_codon:yes stop_codon:yes gene_type:complete